MTVDSDLQAKGTGRSWNYRAIRFELGEDSHCAIHEVHYQDGRPLYFSEAAAPVMWFEAEGPETGLAILERMRSALEKPILTEADFRTDEPNEPSHAVSVASSVGGASRSCGEEREIADWDSMPAVGRERFWLASSSRYPLKTLIELRRIARGPSRPPKGSTEAKLANMRRRIRA